MKAYNFRYDKLTAKTSPSILFIADIHFDSIHCDRNLLTRHMRYCQQNHIDVFILGDLFDCMGGKYDKRTSKEDIRPEYNRSDYFNAIVDDAVNYFKKYDVVKFVSEGNHETSVRARHEIDLTKMFCRELGIQGGDYRGFITINLRRNGGGGKKYVISYTHGSGGNSPVTKGVIKTNRRSSSIDADLYISAHLHQAFQFPTNKWYVDNSDNIKSRSVHHVQTGTYENASSLYADMREHEPSSKGGWIAKFRGRNDSETAQSEWMYELVRLEH